MKVIVEWTYITAAQILIENQTGIPTPRRGVFDHAFHTPQGTMACILTGTTVEAVPLAWLRIVNGFEIVDGHIKKARKHKRKSAQIDLDLASKSNDTSSS